MTRVELQAMAGSLSAACGRGVGFAVFIRVAEETVYLSNGMRTDVLKALEEWLERTSGRLGKNPKETPPQADARLDLERRCADIGKTTAQAEKTELALFLFGMNNGANHFAYWTNMPKARTGIASWVKHERGKS